MQEVGEQLQNTPPLLNVKILLLPHSWSQSRMKQKDSETSAPRSSVLPKSEKNEKLVQKDGETTAPAVLHSWSQIGMNVRLLVYMNAWLGTAGAAFEDAY